MTFYGVKTYSDPLSGVNTSNPPDVQRHYNILSCRGAVTERKREIPCVRGGWVVTADLSVRDTSPADDGDAVRSSKR